MDGPISDGEEDVCRVCRLEADDDNPMVHPCKCSGSVRFVHPECLKSWLAMSQKKHCEICGHRYAFTKVYPDHLPSIIPPSVYIRQTAGYLGYLAGVLARCWLVGAAWLVVLPLFNSVTLTGTGGAITRIIIAGLAPDRQNATLPIDGAAANGTSTMAAVAATAASASASAAATRVITTTYANGATATITATGSMASAAPFLTRAEVLERVLSSQLGLVVPVGRLLWRSWQAGTLEFLPTPSQIFRAQVLSVGIAALIIALIFIREWFATYDWPVAPAARPVETPIDPDEWVVERGVARRAYERDAAGVLQPRPRVREGTEAEGDGMQGDGVGATGEEGVPAEAGLAIPIGTAGASFETDLEPENDAAAAERRRSEGDKDRVSPQSTTLEAFPDSPAPLLVRSNSSPPRNGNASASAKGQSAESDRERDRGHGHAHAHAYPQVLSPLAAMRPPPLRRTFSQLEKSPQMVGGAGLDSWAEKDGEVEVEVDAEEGKEERPLVGKEEWPLVRTGGSAGGPGPSTLNHRAKLKSRSGSPDAASASLPPLEPIVSPALPLTAPDASTSTAEGAAPRLSPAAAAVSTAGPHASTSASVPNTTPTTPRPLGRTRLSSRLDKETWRAPELLAGVSMGKGKGKARAAEPELARESSTSTSALALSSPGQSQSPSRGGGVGASPGVGGSEEDMWVPSPKASLRGTPGRGSLRGRAGLSPLFVREKSEGRVDEPDSPTKGMVDRAGAGIGDEGVASRVGDTASGVAIGSGGASSSTPGHDPTIVLSERDGAMTRRRAEAADAAMRRLGQSSGETLGVGDIAGEAKTSTAIDAALSSGGPTTAGADSDANVTTDSQSVDSAVPGEGKRPASASAWSTIERTRSRPSPKRRPIPSWQLSDEVNERVVGWEELGPRAESGEGIGGDAKVSGADEGTAPGPAETMPRADADEILAGNLDREGRHGGPIVQEDDEAQWRAEDHVDPLGVLGNLEQPDWEHVPEDDPEVVFEDEDGGWNADEWDQIFEVLGFRGPLSHLVQNLALALSIMTATQMILVILPMTTGRLVLAVDFLRAFIGGHYIAFKWIRGVSVWVRAITNPMVDLVWAGVKVFFRPLVWGAGLGARMGMGVRAVLGSMGVEVPSFSAYLPDKLGAVGITGDAGNDKVQSVLRDLASIKQSVFDAFTDPSARSSAPASSTLVSRALMPVFDALALVGNKAHGAYEAHRAACLGVAASASLRDSALSVLVGYLASVGAAAALGLASSAGWVRVRGVWADMLSRWNMFMKLSLFIALELVAFPLSIGAYITLAAMPIFPGMTLEGRLRAVREETFGTLFVCWLVGTMFMYGFAQVLSWVRSMCRPGTLYFVRDPHDPNYSAVKEMIERPTHSQLRKMVMSTLMYGTVIWMLFGMASWGVWSLPGNTLPLRLKGYTPFDYLFLLIVVPPTIDSIRPRHTIKKILMSYWRVSTKLFRLRPLLIGKRYSLVPANESRPERILWATLDYPAQLIFGKYDASSTLTRVPAADQVVLPSIAGKRIPMFVALDEDDIDLAPRTRDGLVRMVRQDEATRAMDRDPKRDFVVVRLPRFWRTRIQVFVLAMLAFCAVFVAGVVLGPVVVGRWIMGRWFGEVHDGYSYIAGSYNIYLAVILGQRARRALRALTRARYLHRSPGSVRAKRVVGRVIGGMYAVTLVFGLHPMMRGLLWELRLGLLVRFGMKEGRSVVHLWDAWALGAVLDALELGACGLFTRHERGARDDVMHGIQRRPLSAKMRALHGVVAPSIAILAGKISLSYVVAVAAVQRWHRTDEEFANVAFRLSGIVVWAVTELLQRRHSIAKRLSAARQAIIDAEYVVEERVENYVADKGKRRARRRSSAASRRSGGGGREVGDLEDELVDEVAGRVRAGAAVGARRRHRFLAGGRGLERGDDEDEEDDEGAADEPEGDAVDGLGGEDGLDHEHEHEHEHDFEHADGHAHVHAQLRDPVLRALHDERARLAVGAAVTLALVEGATRGRAAAEVDEAGSSTALRGDGAGSGHGQGQGDGHGEGEIRDVDVIRVAQEDEAAVQRGLKRIIEEYNASNPWVATQAVPAGAGAGLPGTDAAEGVGIWRVEQTQKYGE